MASPWLWNSVVLLVIVTVASTSFPAKPPETQITKTDYYHLPQSVTPTSYIINLFPRINEGLYNGSIQINITCLEPTSNIILNAHQMVNITHVEIKNIDNNLEITNISRNSDNETITISVENELEEGASYQLHFMFNGRMRTTNELYNQQYGEANNLGFFRDTVMNALSQNERWYAGIFMSPRSLRRVFPCFDEPSFKATFQLSITHLTNMSALSVMPVESSELSRDDLVYDHFLTTPPISTSSFNVLITDFEKNNVTSVTTPNGDFNLYTHYRDNIPLDISSQINKTTIILQYLHNYLGVPYQLPKIHLVNMPNYFFTTMSSFLGVITIPEFISPGTDDIDRELVNQWFKHMTTPEQWEFFNVTDILADYIINDVVDKLGIKVMRYKTQKEDLYNIFGSQYSPGGYWQRFDITKGSWFLQMLNSSMTENTIQTALGNLVKHNLYGTYTFDTLWEEITKQSHADGSLPESITVQEISKSWLTSQHFPVLTITRNYEDDTAKLQQHVYIRNLHQNITESEKEILWFIPITYLTNSVERTSMSQPVVWMNDSEMVINNLPDVNSYIIINPNDSGMFLVNYDEHNWALISENLKSPENNLSAKTRRKLVLDVMLLTIGGDLNYTTALNVTLFLFNETDYKVWIPFIQHFYSIEQVFQYTSVEPKLNKYIRLLIAPVFGNDTRPLLNNQNLDYQSFWFQAKGLLDRIGYQPLIDQLGEMLNRTTPVFTYYDNETELVIYCPQSLQNESDYAVSIQQFGHVHSVLQKSICKCPGYISTVKRTMNKILDEDSNFSSFEFYQIMQLVTNCPESHNITFNFFLEHFNEFRQRFYYIKDVWNTIVSGVVSKIRTEDQLIRMTRFFKENEKRFGSSSETVKYELQVAKEMVEKNDGRIQDIELWLDQVLPLLKNKEM